MCLALFFGFLGLLVVLIGTRQGAMVVVPMVWLIQVMCCAAPSHNQCYQWVDSGEE